MSHSALLQHPHFTSGVSLRYRDFMNGERSQPNTLYKSSKHYTTSKIMKADPYNKKKKNRKEKNELIFIAGFAIFALSSAYFFFANRKSEGINAAFLVSFVTLASYALMWDGSFTARKCQRLAHFLDALGVLCAQLFPAHAWNRQGQGDQIKWKDRWIDLSEHHGDGNGNTGCRHKLIVKMDFLHPQLNRLSDPNWDALKDQRG